MAVPHHFIFYVAAGEVIKGLLRFTPTRLPCALTLLVGMASAARRGAARSVRGAGLLVAPGGTSHTATDCTLYRLDVKRKV